MKEEEKLNKAFKVMDLLEQAQRYIEKAYEMLKEQEELASANAPSTARSKWDTREQLIFGEDYKAENYGGNGSLTRRFEGMSIETATKLISLGFLDPEMRQNESPAVWEFIDFAEDHPDANFTFHGYVVGPAREDCRVSFEGIESKGDDIDDETIIDFMKKFLMEYRADEIEADNDRLYCWYD